MAGFFDSGTIAPMSNPDPTQKLSAWQAEMDASLRAENSWLALAGLFWLEPGVNRFGSDPASGIVLPARFPASLGSFHFDGGQVRLQVLDGHTLQVNGEEMSEAILQTDHADSPSYITLDGMRMLVIDRPRGIGVRLWDNRRPERQTHPPREWFPINEAFRVPAIYSVYPQPKPVQLPDTFGDTLDGFVDGWVRFEIDGETYSLDATQTSEGTLGIEFRDSTSGRGTYPSGRYYRTDEPVVNGKVMLDFNFAYSPPCAFTGYATCVFAPMQNTLPIRVEAGEIYRGHP
jgi:uncharacterized protein